MPHVNRHGCPPEDIYVLISQSETDGLRVQQVPKEKLLKELNNGEHSEFLDHVPEWCQGSFEGVSHDAVLILKCKVVVPVPKERVVEYDLP